MKDYSKKLHLIFPTAAFDKERTALTVCFLPFPTCFSRIMVIFANQSRRLGRTCRVFGANRRAGMYRLFADEESNSVMMKYIKELSVAMALAMSHPIAARVYEKPTMGWSSWNTYWVNISTELIMKQADAMAEQGLRTRWRPQDLMYA